MSNRSQRTRQTPWSSSRNLMFSFRPTAEMRLKSYLVKTMMAEDRRARAQQWEGIFPGSSHLQEAECKSWLK